MSKKEERLQEVEECVNSEDEEMSVKEIAEKMDISKSYARDLACEAVERGLIDGQKSKPVIGYVFNERGSARTDGGDRNSDLRVLTTREALLNAVRDYAPHRYDEAAGKSLKELRKFVRDQVADATVPVCHAWRFSSI